MTNHQSFIGGKTKRLFQLCLCSVSVILGSSFAVFAASEEELLSAVESESGLPVYRYWYDDYDGDGNKEMFAAAGAEERDTTLWFASSRETVHFPSWGYLYCDEQHSRPEGICTINSSQKLFVMEMGGGGSGSRSMCYYVKDGIAIPAPMAGENLTQIAGTEFAIHASAFDAIWEGTYGTGHTYKRYYLHWTGTEFQEYEGKEISQAELERYAGGADALQQARSEGFSIGTDFRRDNGIINVNLYKEGETGQVNENLTLELDGNSVNLLVVNHYGTDWVQKHSYGGIYESTGLETDLE